MCLLCNLFMGSGRVPMGLATTPRGTAATHSGSQAGLRKVKPLTRKGCKLTTLDTLSVFFLRFIVRSYRLKVRRGVLQCSVVSDGSYIVDANMLWAFYAKLFLKQKMFAIVACTWEPYPILVFILNITGICSILNI